MGQGQEDGIDVGQVELDVVSRPPQVGMGERDRLVVAIAALEAGDAHVGVAFEDADELAADVAGGSDDADADGGAAAAWMGPRCPCCWSLSWPLTIHGRGPMGRAAAPGWPKRARGRTAAPLCAIVTAVMSTPDAGRDADLPDLAIPDGERLFSAIELRTTDDADLVEILLRLREAGAEIVTINTFPATKKGEQADITRVFDIELRDLDAVTATRIAESVPGVQVAGARPTLGQIFGKRVIVVGGGAQVAQVALGAVSESDRHNLRGERISVDTMALVGEENIAAAVRAVADLPRAHILVLAGSLMGGEITRAVRELREIGIPVVALNMAGSVSAAADLVVSDPVQAGTMAVMAIADTARFDLDKLRNRRY